MRPSSRRWTVFSSAIVGLACIIWAIAEYQQDRNRFPYEPVIAALGYALAVLGVVRWKRWSRNSRREAAATRSAAINGNNNVVVDNTSHSTLNISSNPENNNNR